VILLAIFGLCEKSFFSGWFPSTRLITFISSEWIPGQYIRHSYTYTPSQNEIINTLQSNVFSSDLLNESKTNMCITSQYSYNYAMTKLDKKTFIQSLLNNVFDKNKLAKHSLVEHYTEKLYSFFETSEKKPFSLLFFSDPADFTAKAEGVLSEVLPRLPRDMHAQISSFLTERDILFLKRVGKAASHSSVSKEVDAKQVTRRFFK